MKLEQDDFILHNIAGENTSNQNKSATPENRRNKDRKVMSLGPKLNAGCKPSTMFKPEIRKAPSQSGKSFRIAAW